MRLFSSSMSFFHSYILIIYISYKSYTSAHETIFNMFYINSFVELYISNLEYFKCEMKILKKVFNTTTINQFQCLSVVYASIHLAEICLCGQIALQTHTQGQ